MYVKPYHGVQVRCDTCGTEQPLAATEIEGWLSLSRMQLPGDPPLKRWDFCSYKCLLLYVEHNSEELL